MDIKLKLTEDTMPLAQLETLMQILAHQKATISLLCDKYAKTDDEADELYREVISDADSYYKQIYQNLYVRHSNVDPDDILPKK
jgi:hypothetical protein